ncbi:MAG: AIPR family protein [Kofleriaceae bacterium]
MTFAITQRDLDQAWTDHGKKLGGHKNDYFGLLYLARKFGGGVEEHAHKVAFGNNDYGFDAFHVDPQRRILYLFQFKWSDNHQQFKGSMDRLIAAGMERIFGNPHQDQQLNSVLLQLKADLRENRNLIDQVFLQFIFTGDAEGADQSKALGAKREDLETKKYLIDQFFGGREISFTVEFVSSKTKKVGGVSIQERTHVYKVPLADGTLRRELDSGERMHVGFVPMMALHAMHVEMGPRLFDRNIRAGLGGDRPTNRALRAALRGILDGNESARDFAFNHNGVTLSAGHFSVEDGIATIVEPRVLNGAQTLTSFATFMEEHAKHPAMAKGLLDGVHVLAKVVETHSAALVTRVTICNNRQNPVEAWHLRASDAIQLEFEDKFRDDLKIFYERQENSFEAMQDTDLESLGIEHNKAIEIRKLAQAFLAVQGEIDRMSRLSEVFESQKIYENTFRRTYLDADARHIVVAYKIQFRLRRAIQEILERGAAKYAYLERARNLVWALLHQGLLNDYERAPLLEDHGADLKIDATFSGTLYDVASRRVRPILAEAVKSSDYEEQISQERYTFLRSKAFFDLCMDVAHKKWKWTKQPLK